MASISQAVLERRDNKTVGSTNREGLAEVPQKWVELLAFWKFCARGERHGFDRQDWYEAERELSNSLSSLKLHPADSTSWTILNRLTPTQAVEQITQGLDPDPGNARLNGEQAIRLFQPPEEPERTMIPRVEEVGDLSDAMKETREKMFPHPHPLMLSEDKLVQYRGQVIATSTVTGEIIASNANIKELRKIVSKLPNLRGPVRYIEIPCANGSTKK